MRCVTVALCVLLAVAFVDSFSHEADRARRLRRARQAVEVDATQESLMEEWLSSFTESADSTLQALKNSLHLEVVPATDITLVKELGSGSFGEVHLIRKGGKDYALKTLKWAGAVKTCHAADEADNERKFQREVTVAHLFSRDGTLKNLVVNVEFLTLRDGKPSVAFGLARTPKDVVYTDAYWTPTKVLGGMKQLAQAIERIHALGYEWDDVALRNVLVSAADPPVLLANDFGRTVATGAERDCCSAPEYPTEGQSYPSTADPKMDVWGFGSLVWAILAGKGMARPWQGTPLPTNFRFASKLHARASKSSFEAAAAYEYYDVIHEKYASVLAPVDTYYSEIPSSVPVASQPPCPFARGTTRPHTSAVMTAINLMPTTWKGIITACWADTASARPTMSQVIALIDAAIAKGDAHADNKLPSRPSYT